MAFSRFMRPEKIVRSLPPLTPLTESYKTFKQKVNFSFATFNFDSYYVPLKVETRFKYSVFGNDYNYYFLGIISGRKIRTTFYYCRRVLSLIQRACVIGLVYKNSHQ